ncbi:O-antigen assembly polymerase, partial [Klebsiella pneumoniae]
MIQQALVLYLYFLIFVVFFFFFFFCFFFFFFIFFACYNFGCSKLSSLFARFSPKP